MKANRKAIESFLSSKKIAIAGVSRNSRKFGYTVFKELSQKGFDVYPINPNTNSLGGTPCFQSVSALPSDVKNLLIVTPKNQTTSLIREAVSSGISGIWIQQMSETTEAIQFAEENKVNLISKECILMWADPVKSFHRFHRNLKKLFGLLPK
jgi:predicted CoA-binding protein